MLANMIVKNRHIWEPTTVIIQAVIGKTRTETRLIGIMLTIIGNTVTVENKAWRAGMLILNQEVQWNQGLC